MSDPEITTDHLPPADLQEVEVDEADELSRPLPLEAEPADVTEQRTDVPLDEDDVTPDA